MVHVLSDGLVITPGLHLARTAFLLLLDPDLQSVWHVRALSLPVFHPNNDAHPYPKPLRLPTLRTPHVWSTLRTAHQTRPPNTQAHTHPEIINLKTLGCARPHEETLDAPAH